MRVSSFLLLGWLFGFVACGGQTDFTVAEVGGEDTATPDAFADSSADAPIDAPTDSDVDAGADVAIDAPPRGCPLSPPSQGAACSPDGLVCGYGDDPRPQCRPRATCMNGSFQLALTGCPPRPTETCPATAVAANGQTCTTQGAYCTYSGGAVCACSGCLNGPCSASETWHCDAPPATAGCPRSVPNLGTPCAVPNLVCQYGSCAAADNAQRKCLNYVWIDEPVMCPSGA